MPGGGSGQDRPGLHALSCLQGSCLEEGSRGGGWGGRAGVLLGAGGQSGSHPSPRFRPRLLRRAWLATSSRYRGSRGHRAQHTTSGVSWKACQRGLLGTRFLLNVFNAKRFLVPNDEEQQTPHPDQAPDNHCARFSKREPLLEACSLSRDQPVGTRPTAHAPGKAKGGRPADTAEPTPERTLPPGREEARTQADSRERDL